MVLEYLHADLFDFVSQGASSEEVCRYYFNQLLEAINYMHSNHVAHLDLKPDNIMLDKLYNLRISDFGVATRIKHDDFLNTYQGTKFYMAPEIIEGKPY